MKQSRYKTLKKFEKKNHNAEKKKCRVFKFFAQNYISKQIVRGGKQPNLNKFFPINYFCFKIYEKALVSVLNRFESILTSIKICKFTRKNWAKKKKTRPQKDKGRSEKRKGRKG